MCSCNALIAVVIFRYSNCAGTVTSNCAGTVTSNCAGTVTSNCAGTVTSNCAGTVTSNCAGTVTSKCAGTVTSNCAGTVTSNYSVGSKAQVCGRSPVEFVGSNPTVGIDVCCVVRCQVEVSATSRSLTQRSPTDCGASLCVI